MKHGAKNRLNTKKILSNNNVHTHTRTHARTHARTHPPTLLFWLTNNLKHSIVVVVGSWVSGQVQDGLLGAGVSVQVQGGLFGAGVSGQVQGLSLIHI